MFAVNGVESFGVECVLDVKQRLHREVGPLHRHCTLQGKVAAAFLIEAVLDKQVLRESLFLDLGFLTLYLGGLECLVPY